MGIRRLLRRKTTVRVGKAPDTTSTGDNGVPRNGRITLAVAGAALLLFGLVSANVRLMSDHSVIGRPVPPAASVRPDSEPALTPRPAAGSCEPREATGKPEVTFYSKLVAPDESPQAGANQGEEASAEGGAVPKPVPGGSPAAGALTVIPPAVAARGKLYTVQVGAFAHPAIAQQWAARWKTRGYEVSLRPVARPSGVIYRLYLGNFTTEAQADELVTRLKTKEGISALRLTVRN